MEIELLDLTHRWPPLLLPFLLTLVPKAWALEEASDSLTNHKHVMQIAYICGAALGLEIR